MQVIGDQVAMHIGDEKKTILRYNSDITSIEVLFQKLPYSLGTKFDPNLTKKL